MCSVPIVHRDFQTNINKIKTMKNLLALIVLFIASVCFAQQPPIAICLTNITITITDTNAAANGTNTATIGNNTTIDLHYNGCPCSDTVVGFVQFRCDTSSTCGGGCQSGGSFTLTMPRGVNDMSVRIYSIFGCCTLTHTDTVTQFGHCDLSNCGGCQ